MTHIKILNGSDGIPEECVGQVYVVMDERDNHYYFLEPISRTRWSIHRQNCVVVKKEPTNPFYIWAKKHYKDRPEEIEVETPVKKKQKLKK